MVFISLQILKDVHLIMCTYVRNVLLLKLAFAIHVDLDISFVRVNVRCGEFKRTLSLIFQLLVMETIHRLVRVRRRMNHNTYRPGNAVVGGY